MEYQDQGVRMVQRGQRVALGPQVNSDQSDSLEIRENLVYLDFLDILEDWAQRDLLGSQDSQAQMARREQGVSLANLDPEDKEDQRVPEGREDREEQQENQEQRGHQEVTAPLDLLERGDCPGLREPTVFLDQKDPLDLQGKTACPGILDRGEKLVSKARWVHLEVLESSDLRVHLERLAPWVSVDTPDPQAHPENRVCQVPRGKKEPKETPVLLEVLVKMGPQD